MNDAAAMIEADDLDDELLDEALDRIDLGSSCVSASGAPGAPQSCIPAASV